MQFCRTISDVRRAVSEARGGGVTIGFIPTMGALHAGHLSLIDAARADGSWPVVSIFVNPTQFGPNEDFGRYPRDEAGDLAKCRGAGAELVFLPAVEVMYRAGATASVHVSKLTDTLCGPHRPGHFEGVATIVTKLFNIVQPDVAYFGQKDAQQLAVIKRMVVDLDFPIRIVGVPTMREGDGLAMSSRNAYLTADERERALSISRALNRARELVAGGEVQVADLLAEMRAILDDGKPDRIDYVSAVDAETLGKIELVNRPVLIAIALYIGRTRLIDNITVEPPR